MKKSIFKLSSFVLIFTMIVGLVSCGKRDDRSAGYEGTVDGVAFELADLGKDVNLHTDLQNEYLGYLKEEYYFDGVALYADGGAENSRPLPVRFAWTAESTEQISSYTVNISENKDMSAEYSVDTTENELDVYNLKIATTYYWTVTANTSVGGVTSGTAHFTTSGAGPRNLYVDGITNVRDLGGYDIGGGKKARQGMIYRCARLNVSDDPTPTIQITDDGIYTMKTQLGIKTEIDLRSERESGNLTGSPLGAEVNYFRISMDFSGNIMTENTEEIKAVFEALAKEENYPLIFHCNIGTDRTGLIAFLVNALLGVSENDLCLDYVWSNFGAIGGARSMRVVTNTYLPFLNESDGKLLKDKVYNYLTGIGVSAGDLDAVISILS